jgi:antitoxin VapB
MAIARVFQSGNSQAVRLPKEFRFEVDELEILRQGSDVVLRVPQRSAVVIFDALVDFPEDLMAEGRDDAPPQEREGL